MHKPYLQPIIYMMMMTNWLVQPARRNSFRSSVLFLLLLLNFIMKDCEKKPLNTYSDFPRMYSFVAKKLCLVFFILICELLTVPIRLSLRFFCMIPSDSSNSKCIAIYDLLNILISYLFRNSCYIYLLMHHWQHHG